MKLRRWVGLSSFSMAVVVVACGGADSTDPLKPATTQLPNDPSGTSSGSANPPATGTAPDATAPDAATPEEPDASSDESDASSADAGVDSGHHHGDDGEGDATIRCGTGSCHAGTQVCCASLSQQGKPKFQCQQAGVSSCTGVKLACDDKSDCAAGTVCCAARNESSFVATTCQATCESTEAQLVARLCDPKAAVDECASIGKKCGSTDFGYFACRD